MLLPGCRCCGSCGDCETHSYSIGGLPLGTCRNQLVHTKTITIPEKFSLPCRVKIAGGVDDDLEVNGTRVRYQLSEYSTTCAVRYEHIESVENYGASNCPGAHLIYYCFLSYERTFTISLFDNFGDASGYDLQICFGGGCVEPPPLGACCEFKCDDCSIQPQSTVSQEVRECQQLGVFSEEFPQLAASRQNVWSELPTNAPVQWATNYPAALSGKRFWIVRDGSEYAWCGRCGNEVIQDLAYKYRWYIVWLDCVNSSPPTLRQISGADAFVGKLDESGARVPVEESGAWSTPVLVDGNGDAYPASCRPSPSSLAMPAYRPLPFLTCRPTCSSETEAGCNSKSASAIWYQGAPCETACVTYTTNPNPLP